MKAFSSFSTSSYVDLFRHFLPPVALLVVRRPEGEQRRRFLLAQVEVGEPVEGSANGLGRRKNLREGGGEVLREREGDICLLLPPASEIGRQDLPCGQRRKKSPALGGTQEEVE